MTKSKWRLSFSVIFGCSDLISLSNDVRNAAVSWTIRGGKAQGVCKRRGKKKKGGGGRRTIKTRFNVSISRLKRWEETVP